MESGVLVVLKVAVHRLHQMGLVLLWTGAPKRLSMLPVIWRCSKMKPRSRRSVLLTDWIGRKVLLRELWNLCIIICNILELFIKHLRVKLWVSWRQGEFWELMHRRASVLRRLKLARQKRGPVTYQKHLSSFSYWNWWAKITLHSLGRDLGWRVPWAWSF